MKQYIVKIGKSYLTSYQVVPGRKTEVVADIRETGINPYVFQYLDEARIVADALGGKIVEVHEEGGND
ncbi:hypothetical protein [Limosilactobacillus reuteri]|uniref:Uncharacterized protein n=1 Tax=Limosilactobacillus reuteri TaxID=1598 RepID=A0A256SJ69_LIMRT|nr:hypothetical protein [Limosilactobacillus reuteri]OYS66619.1 hypothetical protein CBF96_09980 [Limosilactobacillus reuteri]